MIIWLSSYPKSGNTWLRSILVQLLFNEKGVANNSNIAKIGNELKLVVTFDEAVWLNFHVGRIDESPKGSPAFCNILSIYEKEFSEVIFSIWCFELIAWAYSLDWWVSSWIRQSDPME